MAYIKNKLLNINVTADNDRQLMIAFYKDISRKIPLFARRVNEFMRTEWMPKHSKSKNPLFAATTDELSSSDIVRRNVCELDDGWIAHLNDNANGYRYILNRIEDTFDIRFDYEFRGSVND